MKSAAKLPNDRPTARFLITVLVVWAIVGLWAAFGQGCASTVAPKPVESAEASFDGSQQNSGIVMSTAKGFVVTDNFRARYNLLVATYGRDFIPPLVRDAGISPIGEDRWLFTKQGMIHFLEMNAWRKASLAPKNP